MGLEEPPLYSPPAVAENTLDLLLRAKMIQKIREKSLEIAQGLRAKPRLGPIDRFDREVSFRNHIERLSTVFHGT